jgi:hypothetical protein
MLPNVAAFGDHDTTSAKACCLLSFGWGFAQPQIAGLVVAAAWPDAACGSVDQRSGERVAGLAGMQLSGGHDVSSSWSEQDSQMPRRCELGANRSRPQRWQWVNIEVSAADL